MKDFEGYRSVFYNESTGHQFLKLSFNSLDTEKPKIGFLRLGLSFLKVQNLSIELKTDYTEKSNIIELFERVSLKKGVRYAVAEPIELKFLTKEKKSVKICATKGKFNSGGLLRVWGDVEVFHGENKTNPQNVTLMPDRASNSFLLSMNNGKQMIKIPLHSYLQKKPATLTTSEL